MTCNNSLITQAFFDGTLDAPGVRDAAAHLESCADCARLLKDLEAIRRAIRHRASYYRADAVLRARVEESIAQETSPFRVPRIFLPGGGSFWAGAASGIAATAAAAVVAFFLLLPGDADEIADGVAAAHARSLQGSHLVDISSNNTRLVRSWLVEHAGIAPPVTDLKANGFALAGARLDYVYEGTSGAVVYREGAHVVNLFAWIAGENVSLPNTARAGGYNIVFWKRGNTIYCAVSNLPPGQLQRFANLVRHAG